MNTQLARSLSISLMLAVVLSPATILAAPSVAKSKLAPIATKVQSDYLIQKGRVGKITKAATRADLVRLFGAANLEDYTDHGPEGMGEIPATAVTIAGKRSIVVWWTDEQRQQPSSVRIMDSRWHTAEGITIGTTVSQLHQRFGKFSFYGFGWDYSGLVVRGNAKLDRYRQSRQFGFSLGLPENSCSQGECRLVMGDDTLSSDNQTVRRLKAQVVEMFVWF